jgi:sulfide:quinone oxidoreductase
MLVPPFGGARVIRESPGLGDEKGFVVTDDSYRHQTFQSIFAAPACNRARFRFAARTR